PDRRDVDHLHREERILGAAEPLVGKEAGDAERYHQEQDQRGMADRPGGKIEPFHRTLHFKDCCLPCRSSLRAKRSNPGIFPRGSSLDCFVAYAPRNDACHQNDSDDTTLTFWLGSSFCPPSPTT